MLHAFHAVRNRSELITCTFDSVAVVCLWQVYNYLA